MSARILVTGVAGFVGSHVAALLLARGDEVIGVDNFDPYYSSARKEENIEELHAGRGCAHFTLLRGDIRERELMERLAAEGIDAIAHVAGRGGVRASVEEPGGYFDVHVFGTLNVLELARRARVRNVVLVSTSSAYGNAEPPFVETHAADRPLSPYAASKRAAEMLCHSYHHVHGIPCTVVRLFTAYGPRNRPDMLAFKVLDSIFRKREIPLFGGDMVRDWTYVEDIARGIVAALDRVLGYEIINLGHGHPVRVRDFIETIERIAGQKAHLVPAMRQGSDALATGADIEKARRLLGFEPQVSLEEGVERLFQWYTERIAGPAFSGRARHGSSGHP